MPRLGSSYKRYLTDSSVPIPLSTYYYKKKKLGQRMDNEDFTINQINNNYIIDDNIKINNVNNDAESITINYPQITNSDLQNEEQVIIFYSFMIIY
jgi:hypothetical protein